jgi:hypothetical protein
MEISPRLACDTILRATSEMATVRFWDHWLSQTPQESADLCNATGLSVFLLTKVVFSPTPSMDFPLRDKHFTCLSGVAVEG